MLNTIATDIVNDWLAEARANVDNDDALLLCDRIAEAMKRDRKQRERCAEHKRALVCPNCEARKRGKKGALATQKKFDKETRLKWARKGGRPVTRSDAQESSLNVANE